MSKSTAYVCDNCQNEYTEGGTQDGSANLVAQGQHEEISIHLRTYKQGYAIRLFSGQTDRDICGDCLKKLMLTTGGV